MKESTITKLLDQYWAAVERETVAKKLAKDLKQQVLDAVAITRGPLSEEEAEDFQKVELTFQDRTHTAITGYLQSRVSPDWDYLEETLTKKQLEKAKIVSYTAAVKITPFSKKSLAESDVDEE